MICGYLGGDALLLRFWGFSGTFCAPLLIVWLLSRAAQQQHAAPRANTTPSTSAAHQGQGAEEEVVLEGYLLPEEVGGCAGAGCALAGVPPAVPCTWVGSRFVLGVVCLAVVGWVVSESVVSL